MENIKKGWTVLMEEWAEHMAKVREEENFPELSPVPPTPSQEVGCEQCAALARKPAS
jgi:hypothetical protein